jgi:hypothetical protein
LRNIICKLPSGETVELKPRKAQMLIQQMQAIAIGYGAEIGETAVEPETMEGPNVARRGRPRTVRD